MTYRLRELVEDPVYTSQLENLGYSDEQLDTALEAVAWALATNPERFPVIKNTQRLRMVKTYPYSRDDAWIPTLKIWFTIEDQNHVLLRGITLGGDVIE